MLQKLATNNLFIIDGGFLVPLDFPMHNQDTEHFIDSNFSLLLAFYFRTEAKAAVVWKLLWYVIQWLYHITHDMYDDTLQSTYAKQYFRLEVMLFAYQVADGSSLLFNFDVNFPRFWCKPRRE